VVWVRSGQSHVLFDGHAGPGGDHKEAAALATGMTDDGIAPRLCDSM
jgi:hypothetical protein